MLPFRGSPSCVTPILFENCAKSEGTGLLEPQFAQQSNLHVCSVQVCKDVCRIEDSQYLLDVAPHVDVEVIGLSSARSTNFGKKPWPYVDEIFQTNSKKMKLSFLWNFQRMFKTIVGKNAVEFSWYLISSSVEHKLQTTQIRRRSPWNSDRAYLGVTNIQTSSHPFGK